MDKKTLVTPFLTNSDSEKEKSVLSSLTIYTTPICPYCVKAKNLLKLKNTPYVEIDVSDPELRRLMMEKAGGRRSVPQIFVGDFHIGGCDDLYKLESEGKLDKILTKEGL
jgi:glutaredoxin 3